MVRIFLWVVGLTSTLAVVLIAMATLDAGWLGYVAFALMLGALISGYLTLYTRRELVIVGALIVGVVAAGFLFREAELTHPALRGFGYPGPACVLSVF